MESFNKYTILLIIIFLLIVGVVFAITCCADPQEEFRGQILTVLVHLLSIVLILGHWKKYLIPYRIFLVILFVLNAVLIVFALMNIYRYVS